MNTCPICGSDAGELDRTGDAEGFDCRYHGKFKVSGTVLVTKEAADRHQWEDALQKARDRATGGEWPVVTGDDF